MIDAQHWRRVGAVPRPILATICATLIVANLGASRAAEAATVRIVGGLFHVGGSVTYPGAAAEGLLLNVRMVNSTFEDTGRSGFNADANTDEFLAVMPDYVAHGVRAFSLSLQGGNPGYEGAVNTAFRSDGSLRSSYLARVARVIRAADALGAIVILNLYYQRQDEHLADSSAVRNGVINVATWVTQEGFTNVLLEIANEYAHGGYNHSVIQSSSGIASLIRLAKITAPQLYVSASGMGDGQLPQEVAEAADYLIIHFNETDVSEYDARINALKSYGKPIVVTEDPKTGSSGADAGETAVRQGASWGFFLRANQDYPFNFLGASDDPTVYARLRSLATPSPSGLIPNAPTGVSLN